MAIGTINAAQPHAGNQKWQIPAEKKENTPQTYGSPKDIAATLGILASIGIATMALVKSKSANKVAVDAKKVASDVNNKINTAVDKAVGNVKEELESTAHKTEPILGMQAFASNEVLAGPNHVLISEWESYTPDRLAKSPALRARKKEIKNILAQKGYAYDRKLGHFVLRENSPFVSANAAAKSKELGYDLAKVNILNNYLKTLPKNNWNSIIMNSEGKDYIVANILNKEFNIKSDDIENLREQCRTLKKYIRVIKGKVIGTDAPKMDLQNEINALIEKITARIDEVKI